MYVANYHVGYATLRLTRDADDKEFCVHPLTEDCALNPFRCREDSSYNSEYLFHAVMALSTHHIWKDSNGDEALFSKIHHHKSKAVQLYCQSLTQPIAQSMCLIDTLLVLITLDVSQWPSEIPDVLAERG